MADDTFRDSRLSSVRAATIRPDPQPGRVSATTQARDRRAAAVKLAAARAAAAKRLRRCDRCDAPTSNEAIQTLRQTMSSPAEYEVLCDDCAWPFLDHDPLDREPSEDELEARRR